jgi:hypothetical protein
MTLKKSNYESFIYQLTHLYPSIKHSTITLYQIDKWTAVVKGELLFDKNITLRVREIIDFNQEVIQAYSYEVYRNDDKLYWYDSVPHPFIPEISITQPHHKHVPPDIKHHRIPAMELSFEKPNIPFLISEIEMSFPEVL